MIKLLLGGKEPTILGLILIVLLDVLFESAIFWGAWELSSAELFFSIELSFTDFLLIQLLILKLQSLIRGLK